VIHCILSDIKGNNCVFVVGSYRNNEIESHSHPLRMFIDKLEECQVQLTKVHLDGLEAAELNTLVSDALGLFPRLSRSLSDIIQRKTKGNPFYVLEFLKSLVEQNLLQYGLRERRWIWDVEKIESEQISESVSELLAQKISSLPKERQTALKIASCFGTSISSDVVSSMSAVADYSFFGRELECAYSEGFMERDVSSGGYKFAHDKVAEAAYGQMKEEDRNRLHYEIGLVLRNSCGGLASDNKLFLCVDQLNRGQGMINGSEEVLQVVQVNHSAASMALKACNFTAALRYAKTALKLIEQDNEFASSKSILSVMASAAYACGHFEEASSAIDTILLDEASLDEKFIFDVYDLKITMVSWNGANK
jgi:predicted ATPase